MGEDGQTHSKDGRVRRFLFILLLFGAVSALDCPTCHGLLEVPCLACDGTGKVTECITCGGRGWVENESSLRPGTFHWIKCPNCYGVGGKPCHVCKGTGWVRCEMCKGLGEINH